MSAQLATDVLVVDDDRDVREALVIGLEASGYRVATAKHGADAIEWLTGHDPPRLILLDWFMPVMTGAEFRAAQLAHPVWNAIPVVALTASWQRLPLGSALASVLKKPISLAELIRVVTTHAGAS